ncbi:hypothetical protein C0J52_10595 [Blattella germanica]|nr:hypothetical protein C0J52_10595 [Blattella germanica]
MIKNNTPVTCSILLIVTLSCNAALYDRPHIIVIIADDLGWNDVSFHGSDQIPTPNIDALAYNGIILNSHYVQQSSTPSLAALMTGRYPIHMGMQGYPILAAEPRGLPPGKILPQYLKELGYTTRAIGKWHLGYYKKEITPIYRGFDSHLGYWNGHVSYYDYLLQEHRSCIYTAQSRKVRTMQSLVFKVLYGNVQYSCTSAYKDGDYNGFDLHRNLSTAWDLAGRYATDVFTDEAVRIIQAHDYTPLGPPLFLYMAHLAVHSGNRGKLLEAPQAEIDKFRHITDPHRRTYAGGHVAHLSHDMDGLNQWEALLYNQASPRREILHNIDEQSRTAAIRFHNWKLVIGTIRKGALDGYFGDVTKDLPNPPYNESSVVLSLTGRSITAASSSVYIHPTRSHQIPFIRSSAVVQCTTNFSYGIPACKGDELCLYDIDNDPCESNNLAGTHYNVAQHLRTLLQSHRATLVKQTNILPDTYGADPKRWNNTWNSWVYDGCALYEEKDTYFNVCDRIKPV